MRRLKSLIIIVFFLGSASVYSQIGVTTYSIYSLGVSTSKDKKISGELKSFFNQEYIEDTLFELSGMYNFNARDYYQFSAGLGIGTVPFWGHDLLQTVSLPVQLEIFPLQNFKQLSFVIELAPVWYSVGNLDASQINVRHLWGIRYTFKNK